MTYFLLGRYRSETVHWCFDACADTTDVSQYTRRRKPPIMYLSLAGGRCARIIPVAFLPGAPHRERLLEGSLLPPRPSLPPSPRPSGFRPGLSSRRLERVKRHCCRRGRQCQPPRSIPINGDRPDTASCQAGNKGVRTPPARCRFQC